jgi:hypothetical protein
MGYHLPLHPPIESVAKVLIAQAQDRQDQVLLGAKVFVHRCFGYLDYLISQYPLVEFEFERSQPNGSCLSQDSASVRGFSSIEGALHKHAVDALFLQKQCIERNI